MMHRRLLRNLVGEIGGKIMFKRCSLCHRWILGEAVRYPDGSIYCRQCHEHLPHCANCGKPVANYKEFGGHVFCLDCFENTEKCDICNMPLVGKYVQYSHGLTVCQHCYETRPHCFICDVPIKDDYHTVRDKIVCPNCYEKAKRCSCCKRIILPGEEYSTFEGYTDVFCQHCMKNALRCDACGRPVSDTASWALGDGRVLCEECNSKAVFDLKTANRLFKEMREFLKSEFGIYIDHSIELRLVRTDQLEQLGTEKSTKGRRRGLFECKSQCNYYTIYMLYGLTENAFQAVAAHEYTHAWQSENCPPDQTELLTEGLARWVEYQVYKKIGDFHAAKMIETDNDPVYGKGFKKIREIVRKKGYYGLLQYVKTQKS